MNRSFRRAAAVLALSLSIGGAGCAATDGTVSTVVDCSPLEPATYVGLDYEGGRWVEHTTDELVGFSATEDSTLYLYEVCVDGVTHTTVEVPR